jgi:hypothetical protein
MSYIHEDEANSNFDYLFDFISNFKPDSMINIKNQMDKVSDETLLLYN